MNAEGDLYWKITTFYSVLKCIPFVRRMKMSLSTAKAVMRIPSKSYEGALGPTNHQLEMR